MDKAQMEMLSVKSAIERTVKGLIASYNSSTKQDPEVLYEEVCRYMASLFASRQIDHNYSVERQRNTGKVSIKFSTNKQYAGITFMHALPEQYIALPTKAYKGDMFKDPKTNVVYIFNGKKWVEVTIPHQEPLGEPFASVLYDNLNELYEH